MLIVVVIASRRQSEAVSPSDLPDSPLDSPRPLSPTQISISAKTKAEEMADNERPTRDDKCHRSENVFEDRPITFATEDTPAVFSLSTSLSSLDEKSMSGENEPNVCQQISDSNAVNESNDWTKSEANIEVNDIKTEFICTSSEDEAEDALLAACISSGN